MEKIKALAKNLGIEMEDITEESEDTFSVGNKEYFVLTNREAEEKARVYILDSIWAFNPSFIAEHTKNGYNWDLEESIKKIQEQCEGANIAILAMIEDEADFVEDAICADGRGRFLSSYDGAEDTEEINGVTYYIYRTN